MNWKEYWQNQGSVDDPFQQVGRKGGQSAHEEKVLENFAAYIAEKLQLTSEDILLDMCCGNGILTQHLARHCKAVLGIDFSQSHIDYANMHKTAANAWFVCGNALQLNELDLAGFEPFSKGFTKSCLCFSFQYFETVEQGKTVVENIFGKMDREAKLLLVDVPDRERWFVYYNSIRKIVRLLKQMLQQRNDMGKFWSEEELLFIGRSLNLEGQKILQPSHFPYAHYRMDYLFSR
jgi:2-polyprenyl-3-methyl-5-hydroxy-6-metoxy-1,4-benzoquinol methylase